MEVCTLLQTLCCGCLCRNPKVRGRVAVALEASTQRCAPEQLLQCDISSLLKAAGVRFFQYDQATHPVAGRACSCTGALLCQLCTSSQ